MRQANVYWGLIATLLGAVTLGAEETKSRWWNDGVQASLESAGDNSAQLETALRDCPSAQRDGMGFLIEHMPQRDRRSLSAQYLLDNCRLAYLARGEVTWGEQIPESIFVNDVLPYANIDETRDDWRNRYHERFLAIARKCQRPGEAAHELNKAVFPQLGVRYSTKRRRANQSPGESEEIGLASCTGLSIILVDACRSVGIPARLTGTALWANKRGNHTWVEVWDDGWHFVGAAEPSSHGLNHAWFTGDASQAQKDVYEHAIFSVSYRKTATPFPLVWAMRDRTVSAVNVTDRYVRREAVPADQTRLMVRVWNPTHTERLAVPVTVLDKESGKLLRGVSHSENQDTNDILAFVLPQQRQYVIHVGQGPHAQALTFDSGTMAEKILEVDFVPSKEAGASSE
ncbi:MAG: transglutaminase domain-containing protein [Planctomycetales bacterium]|nr:transglutaminase domain-containing protein [Planctomycetales bacterium]